MLEAEMGLHQGSGILSKQRVARGKDGGRHHWPGQLGDAEQGKEAGYSSLEPPERPSLLMP